MLSTCHLLFKELIYVHKPCPTTHCFCAVFACCEHASTSVPVILWRVTHLIHQSLIRIRMQLVSKFLNLHSCYHRWVSQILVHKRKGAGLKPRWYALSHNKWVWANRQLHAWKPTRSWNGSTNTQMQQTRELIRARWWNRIMNRWKRNETSTLFTQIGCDIGWVKEATTLTTLTFVLWRSGGMRALGVGHVDRWPGAWLPYRFSQQRQ